MLKLWYNQNHVFIAFKTLPVNWLTILWSSYSVGCRWCRIIGSAYKCLHSATDISEGSAEDQHWPNLSDRLLVTVADQLLLYLVRWMIKLWANFLTGLLTVNNVNNCVTCLFHWIVRPAYSYNFCAYIMTVWHHWSHCRAQLLLGLVTKPARYVTKPTRSTHQPCIPLMLLNSVPGWSKGGNVTSFGCVTPYGTWVPIVVRHVCELLYSIYFTLLYTGCC